MQPSSFTISPSVRREIVKIIDARIAEAHVTKEDFSELKGIVKDLATEQKQLAVTVKDLAEAQKRTEIKVEALAATVKELAAEQKQTAATVKELAAEQKQTAATVKELAAEQKQTAATVKELAAEQKQTAAIVKELAAEQKQTAATVKELAVSQKEMQVAITKLAEGLSETRAEVGGLSRSFSYAFENETYRFLPAVLKERYGLQVQKKIVRAEIGGKEVNLFCHAERNGERVLIVGESKLRLDEGRLKKRDDVFAELEEKVEAVRSEYGEAEIVRLLVTHFATKGFISKAEENGVIVVQSHEW